MDHLKTAIVYFSRTHYTERVASRIAEEAEGKTFSIHSELYPLGIIGFLRGIWRARQKRLDPLPANDWDIPKYDLLIVGGPVWGSMISPPVRSFLAQYGRQAKQLAFFATCGGRGAEETLRQMAEVCEKQPVATLALTALDFQRGSYEEKVRDFVGKIREKLVRLPLHRGRPVILPTAG